MANQPFSIAGILKRPEVSLNVITGNSESMVLEAFHRGSPDIQVKINANEHQTTLSRAVHWRVNVALEDKTIFLASS